VRVRRSSGLICVSQRRPAVGAGAVDSWVLDIMASPLEGQGTGCGGVILVHVLA